MSAVQPLKKTKVIRTPNLEQSYLRMKLVGIAPLIHHNWSDEAMNELANKQTEGTKTRNRAIVNPDEEATKILYVTEDGQPGFPLRSLKASMIEAAHKDIGIARAHVKKSLIVASHDANLCVPLELEKGSQQLRRDVVRVGSGGVMMRFRYQFMPWSAVVTISFLAEMVSVEDVVKLVARAGMTTGVCDWRPQMGGHYGRWEIGHDSIYQIKHEDFMREAK